MNPADYGACRELRLMAAGGGGQLALVHGLPPFHAGFHRPHAATLLEAVLTFAAAPSYTDILVAAGAGRHLPQLQIDPNVTMGVVPVVFKMRSSAEPPAVTTRSEDDDSDLPDSATTMRRFGVARPDRVLMTANNMRWPETLERLVTAIEEACGFVRQGQRFVPGTPPRGRQLFVIDSELLLPDLLQAQERDVPEKHQRRSLEKRFADLPRHCAAAGADLVIVCASARRARALAAGNLIADAAAERDERLSTYAGCFPALGFENARVLQMPALEPERPYGRYFSRASSALKLYDVLRTMAPRFEPGPMEELEALIGIRVVKERIELLAAQARENVERIRMSLPPLPNFGLSVLLLGNPGTGKTTVARIIARIYAALGLLRGGFVSVTRTDLVGQHIGETGPKTRQVLERALGGVLFVDEAYSLAEGGERDFGREALTELIVWMDKHRGEFALLLGGYEAPTRRLLELNEGLGRRAFEIVFPDYSDAELLQIAHKMAAGLGDRIDPAAEAVIQSKLSRHRETCRSLRRAFGNAGDVETLLRGAQAARALRRNGRPATREQMSLLLADDFARATLYTAERPERA